MGNILSATPSIDHDQATPSIDHDQIVTNLPDRLIVEILCKLPLKSLTRFKTVSKQWKGLITSHVIIHKQRQLCDQNNDPILRELSLELQCFAAEYLGFVDKQIASYFILRYRTQQKDDGFGDYVTRLRYSTNKVKIVVLMDMVDRNIMRGIRQHESKELFLRLMPVTILGILIYYDEYLKDYLRIKNYILSKF